MTKTIGILAHVDAGKTTFSEQLLYRMGVIRTPGRVDHKNTLLDHDPMGIPQAADCGAALVLAGHSHQGQFFPYNFFVGRAFPEGYFHGLAKTKNTISIVSAGAGVFQVPLRVGTDSEIVCVDVTL